jgi:thiamine biosynthesis lipoprotein
MQAFDRRRETFISYLYGSLKMNARADFAVSSSVECVRARPLLGTLVEIAATGADADSVQLAISDAFEVVAQVHDLMSYHADDSDISRINRGAYTQAVSVNAHTMCVLEMAQKLAAASGGLFDISVAPTLTRLGFLPKRANMPRISGQGNWQHIVLSAHQVRLTRQLRIDVSGIAKGYAVDCALAVLQNAGMTAGRVSAGGDLRVFGELAQTVHVRHPTNATQLLPIVALTQSAAATSAGYFTQRRYQGCWVTPLINPLTRTAAGVSRSVTVLAADCMTADALTKVVHANPATAIPLLQQFNARAIMLEADAATGACKMFDTSSVAMTNWHARLVA